MATVPLHLAVALPATGMLFTGWLLWELEAQWDHLGTTNQVLAVLLVLATLGFSGIAVTTLHEAFTARRRAVPDPDPGRPPRHGVAEVP